ncbi:MAG: tRNA (adenosine(37)-N6)-threonylcarbamoyltransferase complex transferase subunit TsaD [Verrucomicrobia bacterium RIFCSPHIGHO2_12_FULL_41_10]|nr:MAG: tRNA (adenosine(37)-N6)-threonylcarbamoyltransferase complex transferase subunit TsaD [Verrucomicrobia bacterium RIFCSPHIGHO2_12_FULL_41_10]HLB33631.1 tRNA (adenosine(37)-N6)-threonylcarbamoyltransferase complex transferase subunit TsaD [Chthoniobacterales bacterium]
MNYELFCATKPILAIESSCDETAVAILRPPSDANSRSELFVSLVASQIEVHARFGGVVPEVASRNHLLAIDPLFHEVLAKAQITSNDLGAVVATSGPGLAPALLVGASYAKGVALGLGIPYLAVNHLEGHLLSPFVGQSEIPHHLALLVSGGHTQLTEVKRAGEYHLLGRTQDDAVGEAFDKVAKLLGLPYPGGIEIDRLAKQGDPRRYDFPRALMEKGNLNFSFSGLKTSVRYFLEKRAAAKEGDFTLSTEELHDLCASFQEAVITVLVEKTRRAAEMYGLTCLGVSGGVAANSALRHALTILCQTKGWKLCLPSAELTSDNAAMIAFAGMHRLQVGETSCITQEIVPQWQV